MFHGGCWEPWDTPVPHPPATTAGTRGPTNGPQAPSHKNATPTTSWHGHLLNKSLWRGILKLSSTHFSCMCARCPPPYCHTFFLLPTAGGWTPFINKLLSCFDTKSFLKWTLIKPLEEKASNECRGCRTALRHFFNFCFLASSTRAYEVSLTKWNVFSNRTTKPSLEDNFCSHINRAFYLCFTQPQQSDSASKTTDNSLFACCHSKLNL